MGIVRKTKSVALMLEAFDKDKGAISVVQLIENLKQQMNKTTVYRILDRLEKGGILHSFIGKEGLKWYARCSSGCSSGHHSDSHPHFECVDCGTIECLSLNIQIPQVSNRQIESANIMLQGTCPNCLS